jgi:hypothetical protein
MFTDLFYKLCTCVLFINLGKEYLNKRNIVNILYQSVYIYSKGQLWFRKNVSPFIILIKEIIENILFNPEAVYYSKMEYYNKGHMVYEDVHIHNLVKPEHIEFDLIIYSDYNKNKKYKCANKVCYENFPTDCNYEVTNFKFMSLTLILEEVSYNLDLCNENYNYYIVNNSINKDFLYYFMINIFKISSSVTKDEFKYHLILIDHNVNIKNLDDTHEIIFLKDSYGIFCDKDSSVNFSQTNNNKDDNKDDDKDDNNLERKNNEEDFILT